MGWRSGLVVWAIASTLLVFLGIAGKLSVILVVGGSCLIAWVIGLFLALIDYRQRRRVRREKYRQYKRHLEQTNRAESLDAQLSKSDFEVRLRDFTKSKTEDREPEGARSNMVFWQLEEDSYTKTPTRPQTLFRYLLMRISRLVRQSR